MLDIRLKIIHCQSDLLWFQGSILTLALQTSFFLFFSLFLSLSYLSHDLSLSLSLSLYFSCPFSCNYFLSFLSTHYRFYSLIFFYILLLFPFLFFLFILFFFFFCFLFLYIFSIISFTLIFFPCIFLAHSAGTAEYTDCISAKGYDFPDECPGYDTKMSNSNTGASGNAGHLFMTIAPLSI